MAAKKRKLKPTRKMQFRRRHEGKTDYKGRLALLKSGKPRLVVRRSLKYIRAQIIEFDERGDKTIVAASSDALPGMDWKFACDSIPAAYLTGLMVGKVAKADKISEAVLDTGLYPSTKGSRIYAVVRGVVDAGLKVPHDEKILPPDRRIRGEHIAAHNEKFKDLPQQFDIVKEKIEKDKTEKGERKEKEGKVK